MDVVIIVVEEVLMIVALDVVVGLVNALKLELPIGTVLGGA